MLEKSIKALKKEGSVKESRNLFSLYKYKVRGSYNSCMHFYKRDLSPVRESFVMQSVVVKGSPYKQNFYNYGVNIATSDFRKTLLKGMGENVNCVTSSSKGGKQSI